MLKDFQPHRLHLDASGALVNSYAIRNRPLSVKVVDEYIPKRLNKTWACKTNRHGQCAGKTKGGDCGCHCHKVIDLDPNL